MISIKSTMTLLLAALSCAITITAQNPIIPGHADPHMRVFDGRMYVSVGKDKSPDNKRFFIENWSVFSSEDLVNWKLEYVLDPAETHLGKGYEFCWASDITTRNDKYYLYTSEHHNSTCVFVADQPGGPYKDVLGKSMIPADFSINHEYDPSILVDDDGSQYIVFGRDGIQSQELIHFQIAKLSEDMLSFDGEPRDILTDNAFGFGEKNKARDHQYFHKHGDTYYLSCAGAYMTASSPYGPYENERHTGQNGHSSFCDFNGQSYHMYEWTCEPYGNRRYRQVCMTYLHYKDNGDMVDDVNFLQASNVAIEGKYYKNGVGNYDADWNKIEAEWFFKREGALLKREAPEGGFEIRNIQHGDALYFPKVRHLMDKKSLNFRLSSITAGGGTIEIRVGDKEGTLIGECPITNTTAWSTYTIHNCPISSTADTCDLVFVFKGGKGELLRLESFGFSKE